MDVKLHQLLPLMMLFVANLPTGSSVFQFRPQSNIDVLRTARVEAYSAQPGGWSKLDVKCSRVKKVVKKAAEQFNVTSADIIQAFHKRQQKTCVLFSAWSKTCISRRMHCLALSNGSRDIAVDCSFVCLIEGYAKDGGQVYVSRDPLRLMVSNATNMDAPKPVALLLISCLAVDKVPESRRSSCASIVDADQPDLVFRYQDGHLQGDLEYNPRNSATFDEDASFFLLNEKFYAEFVALESVNHADHFINVGTKGRIQISQHHHTDEFHNAASFFFNDRNTIHKYECSSCKEIHNLDRNAPSDEYSIKTSRGKILKTVYCEMGLNGGGYTFLHPRDLPALTNDEVQAMFVEKDSFLARVFCENARQPYSVIQQPPKNKHIPLKLSLSNHIGYTAPKNIDFLGRVYVYYGYVLSDVDHQGNGTDMKFVNNSYIAVFPNFGERTPSDYDYDQSYTYDRCDNLTRYSNSSLWMNPSGRMMPSTFFSFAEAYNEATGVYIQMDGRPSIASMNTAAVGFR